MTDRLIKNEDHEWIDTEINEVVNMDEAFDLVNEIHEENIKLKNRINELEDDNEKYCWIIERLGKTSNCFGTNSCLNGIVDREVNRVSWLKKYGDI